MSLTHQQQEYAQKLSDEIHRQGGDNIATDLVMAAAHSGLHLSVACAVIEHETHFKNEFGHDPTIYVGAGKVTKVKYLAYRLRRRLSRNRQMQGVGPPQATYWSIQDRADAIGGCWKPYCSMLVCFQDLAANIHTHGTVEGLHRYNGLGAPKAVYAVPVNARIDNWHDYFAGKRKRP